MTDDRRLIEYYRPIQAISAEASREKSARKGHISTLHWWWTPRHRRAATNECFKAQQLGEHYWLCVVWDPLGHSPKLVAVQNPMQNPDHAKQEIIASRSFEIPGNALNQLCSQALL